MSLGKGSALTSRLGVLRAFGVIICLPLAGMIGLSPIRPAPGALLMSETRPNHERTLGGPGAGGEAAEDSVTILTANVGNMDPRCLPYYLKLCRSDVEERIAERIQELRPDVVAIQETLPDWMCERYPVSGPGTTCRNRSPLPQVCRLLGPEYSIVCEARNGFECIAVRVGAGVIAGCEEGALCTTDRLDRQREGCRWNVAVMAATIEVHGHVFDVVNAHPKSRSAACRLGSIRQIFESMDQPGGLVREEDVLVVGDFNLDPWRENDVSTRYWNERVGPGGDSGLGYHSGIAEHVPPLPTLRYAFFRRTYDHVVSNFLDGTTHVLGESPGTQRLDGGSGMDHRAVYGRLSFADGG